MNILPLGSIVTLKNAKKEKKFMIVVRNAILTLEGIKGYTDYAACFYPVGVEGNLHYFNQENIKEVLFIGYIDDVEKEYQSWYLTREINYPKLQFN
ncbi:DUF4176 domain-containing protein [Actinobacillus porcinus]|uniref:DUF4176 domain-containing protein n=1 Tax=Actinobacillus porcinus TaxID=51048 RepID=UPI002A90F7E0|nr:DUF4176 domain-containing protein [Actinobacillus porcinus]MDY6215279.1 DUF4176 domain-containing protein [Actinobacillus porcinus]